MTLDLLPLVFATALSHSDTEPPSGEQILQLALKQRQAITKMTATFNGVLEQPDKKPPTKKTVSRYWIDGNQLRNDRPTEILSFNSPKEGQYIRFHPSGPTGPKVALVIGLIKEPRGMLFSVDPRVLGLQPARNGHLWLYKLDTFLGRADRTKPTLEKGKWKEHDSYIVRFALTTGVENKWTYTIVPALDHSVVRVEYENKDGSKGTCESEMQRYGKPGAWFPKRCVSELRKKDGKLEWRYTTEVVDVTINEPFPVDPFQLPGMNIPVDTPIHDDSVPDKLYKWDGKKIVERETPKKVAETREEMSFAQGDEGSKRTLLLAASGGFALAGVIAVGFVYRKRRPLEATLASKSKPEKREEKTEGGSDAQSPHTAPSP